MPSCSVCSENITRTRYPGILCDAMIVTRGRCIINNIQESECDAENDNDADAGPKNDFVNLLAQFKADIMSKFDMLTESFEFTSGKLVDFEGTIRSVGEKMKLIDELQFEDAALHKTVLQLNNRVHELEQYSRRCNVKIVGVPFKKEENLIDIVSQIATTVKFEKFSESDIVSCARVMQYSKPGEEDVAKKSVHKNIIVQFNSSIRKEEFISATRKKKSLEG